MTRVTDLLRTKTQFEALEQYGRNTCDARRRRQARPGHRPYRLRFAAPSRSCRVAPRTTPCLIGEPGVGKTAIVEGHRPAHRGGRRAVARCATSELVGRSTWARMVAGAKYRGEFEDRLEGGAASEVRAVRGQGHPVDRRAAHHRGRGRERGLAWTRATCSSLRLARGELHAIGATTLDEYRKYIEKDAALARRFQPVMGSEPTVEDTSLDPARPQGEVRDPSTACASPDSRASWPPPSCPIATSRIASCPTRPSTWSTRRASRLRMEAPTACPVEIDAARRVMLTQLQIEEQALMKEDDELSKQRLEELRGQIAEQQQELDKLRAEWSNQIKTPSTACARSRRR